MQKRSRSVFLTAVLVFAVAAAALATGCTRGGSPAGMANPPRGTTPSVSTAPIVEPQTGSGRPGPSVDRPPTGPATTITVPRTPVTTPPRGAVPATVTAVAKTSAGSGEVEVDWNATSRATGYRVLRTNADGDQARVVADFTIATGRATAAPEVVNVWSAGYSYIPSRGPMVKPDRSPRFQYVDVGPDRRCYRVLAYNAAAAGHLSAVTCGAPPGGGRG